MEKGCGHTEKPAVDLLILVVALDLTNAILTVAKVILTPIYILRVGAPGSHTTYWDTSKMYSVMSHHIVKGETR